MVKQRYLEKQLEFPFMEELRKEWRFKNKIFTTRGLLGLTAYTATGLSFYNSWFYYLKPVDANTLDSKIFYFVGLVGVGMAVPYVIKNMIQESISKHR